MNKQRSPGMAPEDVQIVENVMQDCGTPPATRRSVLRWAALGAASFGVLGLAACGNEDEEQQGGGQTNRGDGARLTKLLNNAITAEALAVTYLTGVIQQAPQLGVAKFADVLKAANASEYQHYLALQKLGAKPIATKFFVPDKYLQEGNVFPFLETAETLFVNAYLIAITQFAQAGMADEARYANEILGVEAEHLALARFAQDELPNQLGFMPYEIKEIGGIVSALRDAGIEFGKPGQGAGKVFEFPGAPPADTVVDIKNESVV